MKFLNIGSDKALSIAYVKILKLFLTISASWPYQVGGSKAHVAYWYYLRCGVVWGILAITGEIWFLINNSKILSFYDLGHMYLTCFFSLLGVVRSLLPLFSKYATIMERYLLSFHLIHFKHKGRYYQKVYEKVELLSHRLVTLMLPITIIWAIAFSMIPIVNNIRSGAYYDRNKPIQLTIYFSYPGFNPQNHYKFVTCWNFFLVLVCSVLIGGIDIVMTLFIFQILGHIEILNNTLKTFPTPKGMKITKRDIGRSKNPKILIPTMFTEEDNLIIGKKIKQCVEHHLLIISFTDDVSEFFGPVIAIYYIFHQVAGCIMLLAMSAGDAASLTQYGPLTVVVIGQLVLISTIFEVVNTKCRSFSDADDEVLTDFLKNKRPSIGKGFIMKLSDELVDTTYCVPWESMSLPNQRSVCLLIHRFQRPIRVTALGITPVGVQTMATILKASFSYFTFLRTLKD